MKKLISLLLMLFLSVGLLAQTESQESRAAQMTETLNQVLELDDQQIEKTQLVNLICVKMADEIRDKYAADQKILEQKIKETQVHRDERVLKILNPTQQTAYRSTLKDVARFNSIPDKIADQESLDDLRIDVAKVEKLVSDLYQF